MEWIELTREGGQTVLINTAQIAFVREKAASSTGPVVVMASGTDFTVTESFEEVLELLISTPA